MPKPIWCNDVSQLVGRTVKSAMVVEGSLLIVFTDQVGAFVRGRKDEGLYPSHNGMPYIEFDDRPNVDEDGRSTY